MHEIKASEFKAKCLGILDDVARTMEPVTVLKRGRPVAQVVPIAPPRGRRRYPQDALDGTVRILGDIISPAVPPEDWDAVRGEIH